MELLSSFSGEILRISLLVFQLKNQGEKQLSERSDEKQNDGKTGQRRAVTVIRVATIDERALPEEVRRARRATLDASFGNLRLTIEHFDGVFLDATRRFVSLLD